jgi:hypothetical protein
MTALDRMRKAVDEMRAAVAEECWRCHSLVESDDECLALADGRYRLVCGKCSDAMWPDEPEGRWDSMEESNYER